MTLQIVLSTMVPPQPNRGPDVYLWHNGADHFVPKFSSKAIWHRIRETSPEVPWFDLVWFKEEIPRCSFVCWMAIQSRLPTKDKLSSWGHQCSNALCPLLYGSGVSPAPLLLLSLQYMCLVSLLKKFLAGCSVFNARCRTYSVSQPCCTIFKAAGCG